MKLYIAEKPELGRAIAQALDGKEITKNGYIEKGDDISIGSRDTSNGIAIIKRHYT